MCIKLKLPVGLVASEHGERLTSGQGLDVRAALADMLLLQSQLSACCRFLAVTSAT